MCRFEYIIYLGRIGKSTYFGKIEVPESTYFCKIEVPE
jgi:hypothetical protein